MRTVANIVAALACVLGSSAGSAWGQSILRVNASAPVGGNGASWATAYNTLGAALNSAVAGDEIWVAAGTYTSTVASYAFTVPSQVSMYGGFVGTEATRDQRRIDSYGTVLSGASGKTVLRFAAVQGVVVDGFKVIDGWGCGDYSTLPSPTGNFHPGGGAQFDGSSVVVANCWFDGNRAGWAGFGSGPPSETGEGGAAFVRNSTVSFVGCVFTANRGAPHTTGECRAGSPTMYVGPGGGGAVSCHGSTVSFGDCSFRNNSAGSGWDAFVCTSSFLGLPPGSGADGGALLSVNCILAIDRCWFALNQSGSCGRANNGMWCATPDANPGKGGAIRVSGGSAVVSNSTFVSNIVPVRTADVCSDSRGSIGGAIYSSGLLSLQNCAFVSNAATGVVGGIGGAIGGSVSGISNCIFWDNSDGSGSLVSAQVGATAASIVSRSIVQGAPAGFGNANSNLNPLFLDPLGPDNILGTADDRFDLAIGSPAIDAGDNSAAVGLILDLAAKPRYFDVLQIPDTGVGSAPIIDIGPYEYIGCPIDLDNGTGTGTPDNAVTIEDLLFFLTAFESGDQAADLDNATTTGVHDHAVTIDDLLFFLVHFEAGC